MKEKINLSLVEDFFQSSSPDEYAKKLINTKNADKNKKYVEEIKDRISDLKGRIEQVNDKEKKYENAKKTLEINNKIIDYNNNAQSFFIMHKKLIKKKSEPEIEKSIAERTKLRRQKDK